MSHHNEVTFTEDQKKFRKLRKYLRQIEHLQLLTRELNHEEKAKLRKRSLYREQLNAFTKKYKNDEEFFLLDLSGLTNESSASMVHTNETVNNSLALEEDKKESNVNDDLDQLVKQLDKISIDKDDVEDEQKKTEEQMKIQVSPITEVVESKSIAKSEEKKKIKESQKKIEPMPSPVSQSLEKKSEPNEKEAAAKKLIKHKSEALNKKSTPVKKVEAIRPNVIFKTLDVNDAHEDLIVSIDLCVESKLIATGSRDTSLKVWSFVNPKKIELVHSFGGHSSSITFVQFWKYKYFKSSLETLCKNEDNNEGLISIDDAETILEKLSDREECLPVVVSSSLDQTIRIWDIVEGKCLREIYLYNRVNHFQIHETSFAVGLDGGKVQYWENLKQIVNSKLFDDLDSICCVKLRVNEQSKKLYALSQNGVLKVYNVEYGSDQKTTLKLNDESDVFNILSNTHILKKNFKCFDVINDDQVLMINDNQAFVIFFDIKKEQTMLISTNTNGYGFTNCFHKFDNQFFISAYNIDDASSNINVFQCEREIKNPKSEIIYQYSLIEEDGFHNTCISSLSSQRSSASLAHIASSSNRNIRLWSIESSTKCLENYREAKLLRMCKQTAFNCEDKNESDTESEDDGDNNDDQDQESENELEEKANATKISCNIQ